MSVPAGWQGILDEGETILWQGRPRQGFKFTPANAIAGVFGLFFAGFALFWMVMASRGGGAFWMFGLIHFAVGVGMIVSAIFGGTYARRRTWYTLTDRRAIVSTDFFYKPKSLVSYPITDDTTVEYRAGAPDNVWFGHETRRGSKGRTYTVPVGFTDIDDGHEVMRIVRKHIHKVRDPDPETEEQTA